MKIQQTKLGFLPAAQLSSCPTTTTRKLFATVCSQKPALDDAVNHMEQRNHEHGISPVHKTNLSLIMSIRNETRTIAEVLHGLQRQSYTGFELIAFDEQASKSTRRILEEAAGRDPYMHVLDNLHRFNSYSLEERIQLSIVILVLYLLLDFDFSTQNSRRLREAATLPVLFAIYPLFHFSYGCGSLVSLLTLPFWRKATRGERQV